MCVSISLQPGIGTFLKIEPGVADGDQVDPLLIGQVNALGQFVALDLKQDLGLQQQEVDAGAVEKDMEGAMNLPLQQPGEDPAARVQQVGMGVWDPIPKSAENRRAWALNIMTGLGFQGVTNPTVPVPPAPAHPAPAPPAPAPPAAASRSSGMTLQQWAALEASSGGVTGQAHRGWAEASTEEVSTKEDQDQGDHQCPCWGGCPGGGRHSRCGQTTLLEGSEKVEALHQMGA